MVEIKMAQQIEVEIKTHFYVLLKQFLKFHNWIIGRLNQLMAISRLTNMVEAKMALRTHYKGTLEIS